VDEDLLQDFLAEAAAGAPSDAATESALRALLEAGRAAWPGLDVPAAAFARRVGAAWSARKPELRRLHGADLYLACACVLGDRAALAEVDRLLRDACASLPDNPAEADEVCQRLRERLLLAASGEAPDLVLYSGEGPLQAWLKVVALREHSRRRAPATRGADDLEELASDGPDPEVDYLRVRHRDDFRAAFADALQQLSTRERNLLRMYYLDGVGVVPLGKLYQVHASTASRWLQGIRESLLARTRQLLEERLRLTAREVDSLLAALRSQLGASLERLLQP
jgi:RNA polymerase sigma-70 factor (ECF subfamily)